MKHGFPILLVEDNPVSRKIVEKTLVKAGHDVTTAGTGREALALFKKTFFPIVLTDWMMPEGDGLELCRIIRNTSSEGYVYIILLTARDSKDDIVTGLKAGADDYLNKPISPPELIARLNTGLRVLELEKSLKAANEEIRTLSITDPLTVCLNRGYMNEHLPEEITRSKRYNRPLVLIMCDIDHFKRVNDSHGHQTGDLVLIEFAKQIRETLREDIDWIVRYGGEEFLLVLPETEFRGGCSMAERLRKNISLAELRAREHRIRITASFGVIGFDPSGADDKITMDDMIARADEYLYQAKAEGRNRVCAGRLRGAGQPPRQS
jgi:two-component system cell cycle response regulator